MEEKIFENIRHTAFIGTIYSNEIRRFEHFSFKKNCLDYRLSKIKFFLGDENGKEIILGLQSFYKNRKNNEEIISEESRNKTIKVINIKDFEIPYNDYICKFYLKRDDDGITQIKLITKKGKIIIVGEDEGEEVIMDFINDNKNHMIIGFIGAYSNHLDVISASYINFRYYYLLLTIGYFELKKKVKNKLFKKNIEAKYNQLNESDKALFKASCLRSDLFFSIIKYILN